MLKVLLIISAMGIEQEIQFPDMESAKKLQWTDRKRYGSSYGPTLRQAYDDWVASGRATQVDSKRDLYLGWLQLHIY